MKKILFLLPLFVLMVSCTQDQLSSEIAIPLKEHPRPDFERSPWQNLNGYWQFAPDSANMGESKNWQENPDAFTSRILVPFSWASPLSEITLPKLNIGWYARSFNIGRDSGWKGKNVFLIFGASDFHTKVWINGQFAGEHKGGYVPFEFDITSFIKGGSNRLVVRVEDEELDNRPSGKQYYGNSKGIWQTVYLEPRNEVHLSAILFTPDIDKSELKAEIHLSAPAPEGLQFRLAGRGNNILFESALAAGDTASRFTIPVPDMKLWTLDNPYLYEVTASLASKSVIDSVSTYFGMRKISAVTIPGKDFQYVALNNEPLYLRLHLTKATILKDFIRFLPMSS